MSSCVVQFEVSVHNTPYCKVYKQTFKDDIMGYAIYRNVEKTGKDITFKIK